jgi:hypothetical protein
MKFVNWFYRSACYTSFIHSNLLKKKPPVSWVKHETEGRIYFNTKWPLDPTHLINGIIP